jgi:hypothetical protein
MTKIDYPLSPKTTTHLRPGQFWSIPMSDGRFGCGRVLQVDLERSTRTRFIGAVLDWVGSDPPTADAIAGSGVLAFGNAHVRVITFGGGAILGERPLSADDIEAPTKVNSYWGDGFAVSRAERRFIAGDPPPTREFRQVSSPLTPEMLRPSLTGRGVVQFNSRLSDEDFGQLGEWFGQYPDMTLRAYGSYDKSITDLEFLRFFPTLRRSQRMRCGTRSRRSMGCGTCRPTWRSSGSARRGPASTWESWRGSRSCGGCSSRVRPATSRSSPDCTSCSI